MSLDTLLQSARVWRAREMPVPQASSVPTGFAALDLSFGGGWPRGALTEVLAHRRGIGALSLLTPALARLSAAGGWLALIGPPDIPHAPALVMAGIELARVLVIEPRDERERLWACEQTLRSASCAAVISWAGRIDPRWVRRLQVAAATGGALGVLFRSGHAAREASPAPLRLLLAPADEDRLAVQVLKRRGGMAMQTIEIDFSRACPEKLHACSSLSHAASPDHSLARTP